jgi:hypothetical protein
MRRESAELDIEDKAVVYGWARLIAIVMNAVLIFFQVPDGSNVREASCAAATEHKGNSLICHR